jgi:hypothetical protein
MHASPANTAVSTGRRYNAATTAASNTVAASISPKPAVAWYVADEANSATSVKSPMPRGWIRRAANRSSTHDTKNADQVQPAQQLDDVRVRDAHDDQRNRGKYCSGAYGPTDERRGSGNPHFRKVASPMQSSATRVPFTSKSVSPV